MKIGQEIKFKENFEIEAIISKTKLEIKEGDRALITKSGFKVLTGEARGKRLDFNKDEKAEGYDYSNISKLIFNRLDAVFELERYLDDEEIGYEEFIEEIEDVLMDIL